MLPVLFFSVICHEVAHAWVAWKGGDDTARQAGRITLNPVAHVDIFGTIVVPLLLVLTGARFLIGWAKPVPVNGANLRSHHWAAAVSAAGVTVNFMLAILAAGLLKIYVSFVLNAPTQTIDGKLTVQGIILLVLVQFVVINLVLMIFNLLPIPPLDGSHLLAYFAGPRIANSQAFMAFRQFGFMILILLLATGVLSQILRPIMAFFLGLIGAVFRLPFFQ